MQVVDDRVDSVGGRRLSDREFFTASVALLVVIVAIFTVASYFFLERVYMLGDISIFYGMVDVILAGGTPYLDFADSKPPLVFFTLALPGLLHQKIAGGMALVGLCDLASSVIVLTIAWRLYGRRAGLFGGAFFALNLPWAEGYFILIEPLMLPFVLISAYCLLFSQGRPRDYALAGISIGIAAGFKQYALLFLPVSLLFLARKNETKGALPFLGGFFLALVLVFVPIFAVYGVEAGVASLKWSFEIAGTYLPQSYSGEVTGYAISGPVMLLVNLVLGSSLFVLILIMTIAVYLTGPRSAREEFLFLCAAVFGATVLIRPFFHYWALALPFIALVCASRLVQAPAGKSQAPDNVASHRLLIPSVALFGLITGAFLVAALAVERGFMADAGLFYHWAETFVGGMTPVLGPGRWPGSGLIPVVLPAGVTTMVTGLLVLACAATVTDLGRRLYGGSAGFVAGMLFTVSVALAVGFLTVGDLAALALLLASIRLVLGSRRLFLAGLCIGVAAAFKPLALLAAVAVAYYLWKHGERSKVKHIVPGVVLAILAIFAVILLFPHIATTGDTQRTGNAYLGAANIIVSVTMLTSLLPFVLAGARPGPIARRPEDLLFALSALFILTMAAGEYLYYWTFALPFVALLCARHFQAPGDRKA